MHQLPGTPCLYAATIDDQSVRRYIASLRPVYERSPNEDFMAVRLVEDRAYPGPPAPSIARHAQDGHHLARGGRLVCVFLVG
jgi:hypothetical protein